MLDLYIKKQLFVNKYLKPLILAADNNVSNVAYSFADNEEIVTIEYKGGAKTFVNVNMDSNIAIVRDVFAHI